MTRITHHTRMMLTYRCPQCEQEHTFDATDGIEYHCPGCTCCPDEATADHFCPTTGNRITVKIT